MIVVTPHKTRKPEGVRPAGPGSVATQPMRFRRFDRIKNALLARAEITCLVEKENNNYHQSTVLAHIQKVVEAGRSVLSLPANLFPSPKTAERLSVVLDTVVDPSGENQYTRAELTYAAMCVHDIAKKPGLTQKQTNRKTKQQEDVPVWKVADDGTTSALGHAEVGAPTAARVAKEALKLSDAEALYVEQVVRLHMRTFMLENAIAQGPGKKFKGTQEDFKRAKMEDALRDIGCDPLLVLHTIADLKGSDINSPDISLHLELIGLLLKIDTVRIDFANQNESKDNATPLQAFESLTKRHGVVFFLGREETLRSTLTKALEDQFAPRVAAGKMPAEKVAGIVAKKIDGLLTNVECRSGETAEQVEGSFDYASPEQLKRRPVILQIS
jgi:hypothetical protein